MKTIKFILIIISIGFFCSCDPEESTENYETNKVFATGDKGDIVGNPDD